MDSSQGVVPPSDVSLSELLDHVSEVPLPVRGHRRRFSPNLKRESSIRTSCRDPPSSGVTPFRRRSVVVRIPASSPCETFSDDDAESLHGDVVGGTPDSDFSASSTSTAPKKKTRVKKFRNDGNGGETDGRRRQIEQKGIVFHTDDCGGSCPTPEGLLRELASESREIGQGLLEDLDENDRLISCHYKAEYEKMRAVLGRKNSEIRSMSSDNRRLLQTNSRILRAHAAELGRIRAIREDLENLQRDRVQAIARLHQLRKRKSEELLATFEGFKQQVGVRVADSRVVSARFTAIREECEKKVRDARARIRRIENAHSVAIAKCEERVHAEVSEEFQSKISFMSRKYKDCLSQYQQQVDRMNKDSATERRRSAQLIQELRKKCRVLENRLERVGDQVIKKKNQEIFALKKRYRMMDEQSAEASQKQEDLFQRELKLLEMRHESEQSQMLQSIADMTSRSERLESENRVLDQWKAANEGTVSTLRSEIDQMAASELRLKDKNTLLHEKLLSTTKLLQTTQASFSESESQFSEHSATAKSHLDTYRAEIEDLKALVRRQKEEIDDLRRSQSEVDDTCVRLTAELQTSQERFEACQQDLLAENQHLRSELLQLRELSSAALDRDALRPEELSIDDGCLETLSDGDDDIVTDDEDEESPDPDSDVSSPRMSLADSESFAEEESVVREDQEVDDDSTAEMVIPEPTSLECTSPASVARGRIVPRFYDDRRTIVASAVVVGLCILYGVFGM